MGKISALIQKYKQQSVPARAAFWAFVANVAQKGMNTLATPIFTRLLTTEQYAQYTLYQSWHELFIIFTSLNVFNYCTTTAMREYEHDREGFIASAQTFIFYLTFLCFALYLAVHTLTGDLLGFSLPVVALIFVDLLFFASFHLWAAKERYFFRYRLMTVLSILMGAAGPILGVILIRFSANPGYGRIYGAALVNIIIGLFACVWNWRGSSNRRDKRYWKYILVYCAPLIPHFLSVQILSRFDRIMINDMVSASKAGIYSLAYSVSSLALIVNDAIMKALIPWTYQKISSGNNLSSLRKMTNWFVLLVAALNWLMILCAPEAVKIFATSDYYEAIYIIPAVSSSVFFMFLYNTFANIEYYYAETRFVAMASLAAAVLNIVLNLICIPKFGYIAAGYTTLASYILYAIGHFVFMQLVARKHADGYQFYDNRTILLISVVFVIVSLAMILLYDHVFIRYGIVLIVVAIMFLNRKKILVFFSSQSRRS